ncbi:hypothetical protein SAMN05443247_06485 [Bradyrhizobium erythrophlei]|nr:hypothetical protein SAMN05443247_06485 [Bradyrhizobium erythrophlei]
MQTIKTIPALLLAASLGAGMILVSEAALARNGGGDHQDHSGMKSGNGNGSAARSGKHSDGDTYKNGKSKTKPGTVTWGGSPPRSPPPAGTVTWGGSPPRSPPPAAGTGLHIRGDNGSRTPVDLKSDPVTNGKPVNGGSPPKTPVSTTEPITNGAPISGGSPPRSPVATANPTPAAPPAGVAVVSNGQVKLNIPNSSGGLSVTSDKPGTITVSNGDPSHSVTLPGGSVTISGGQALNTVTPAPGIQVTSHPNGDFVAAANTPVPPPTRTTVTGGPEGGFINALGKTVTSIPAGIVNGVADVLPPYGFKAEATGANVHDPATSTSVQR